MKAKNIKFITIFLVLIFCLVGAVSATEDVSTDTTNSATDSEIVTTQTPHEHLNEKVSANPTKPVTDTTPKENINEEKIGTTDNTKPQTTSTNKTKTTKNAEIKLKAQNNEDTLTETNTEPLKIGKTVEVNNIDELTTAINTAINDAENNRYIINLKEGTYQISTNPNFNIKSPIAKTITINGNNQRITSSMSGSITFNDVFTNIIMKDLTINSRLTSSITNITLDNVIMNNTLITDLNSNLTIQNSILINKYLPNASAGGNRNHGKMIIKNSTISSTYGETFVNFGELSIINSNITTPITNYYKITINKSTINLYIYNLGTLTINNSTINNSISNYNYDSTHTRLIINEDVIFGEKFIIEGDNVEINYNGDINKLLPYMTIYSGNYTFNNITITKEIKNYGNLTINNVNINASITNNGNLTINNSTINNSTANTVIYNNGNLTINNTIINTIIYNYGNLTINNITIRKKIDNYGVLTLGNNITIGTDFQIFGDGQIITDDINKFFIYMNTYSGNYTLNNITITNPQRVNYGNLTINNSTINTQLANYGNLTINNSTTSGLTNGNALILNYPNPNANLTINNSTITKSITNYKNLRIDNTIINAAIYNYGVLTLGNNITIGTKFRIDGKGQIITENINKYLPYITIFSGNYTVNNITITDPQRFNYGNITINNSTINTQIYNYGNLTFENSNINCMITNNVEGQLTFKNCTINSTIKNEGNISIYEETIFTENAKITGTGEIVTNNISKILPNIDTINGKYIIKNTNLSKTYTFNGEITLINCTITNSDNINLGTLILNNCTIDVGENNTFLVNYKIINISEDTKLIGKLVNLVDNGIYTVTNDTIKYFFKGNDLNPIIQSGDTLNFQGNITLNNYITINEPINIISTTEDAYIYGKYEFIINSDYTNITGIHFNKQLRLYANNITLKNSNLTYPLILYGSNNTISNNKIIIDGEHNEYTIWCLDDYKTKNNKITNNYLVSKTNGGDITVNIRYETNIIKNNIPINTKIEIVSLNETIINKTITITIKLVDINGNSIKNTEVLVNSNNGNETLILTNGTYNYQYTPVSIGEDTITVKYLGNYSLIQSINTTTIKIIANPINPNDTQGNDNPKDQTQQEQHQQTPINTPITTKNDIKTQEKLEQKLPAKQISITSKKTITVSKKAKKLTLKVTLKVKGKKVNKRTVKFIIKGKTYTAKTNKKGVAKLTLKKTQLQKILKKVKTGKKLTYKIKYGKRTIERTLKVKK